MSSVFLKKYSESNKSRFFVFPSMLGKVASWLSEPAKPWLAQDPDVDAQESGAKNSDKTSDQNNAEKNNKNLKE